MNIAVIGAGISGLTAAHVLQREHQVTVFESADAVGGHAATIDVQLGDRCHPVDTGFVVFNEVTYPNFVKLLGRLRVASQPTSMSFSVHDESTGLEYCGTSLNTFFAQRRNLLKIPFYRLLLDIVRFNRAASRDLDAGSVNGRTLGRYVKSIGGSESFKTHYLVPLTAAIWSIDPRQVDDFPCHFFLRFLSRHRLLQVREQLEWRVVQGGSRQYVRALTSSIAGPVRTGTPVRSVHRTADGVFVRLHGGETLHYDQVVLALHSDQALRLLADPTDQEVEVLGRMDYQLNTAVVHSDVAQLPRRRRAWASWNYRITGEQRDRPLTTYNMSSLQGLETSTPICITLNHDEGIDPDKIHYRTSYSHPVYTPATLEAQAKWDRISGTHRTHYCGAYWGYGFHEDGVKSALDVCRQLGMEL